MWDLGTPLDYVRRTRHGCRITHLSGVHPPYPRPAAPMKTKHFLLLIVVLASGIFILERAGTFGAGDDPGQSPAGANLTGEADAGPGGNPKLAPPGSAKGQEIAGRSSAGQSQLGGGLLPNAQGGPKRAVKVIVDWPDAARPQGVVEVCAFQEDIGGAAVLRALTTNYKRPSTRSRAFDGLSSLKRDPEAIRDRALAVAPLAPNNLGQWSAMLQVPTRAGRIYAHVVGATYYTPLAAIADLETDSVVARPVRGGELRLRATAADASVDVAGIPFTVTEEQSIRQRASARAGKINSFRLDGRLDSNGEARLGTVPSNLPVKVTVYPEGSAQATVDIPAITPGTAGTAILKLFAGSRLSGRVVDPSGAPIADAEVSASIPGSTFGMDDEVLRRTQSSETGTFEIHGLPAGELIVRASAEGWLEGERSRFTLVEGQPLVGVELAVTEGGTLAGQALLPDGAPAHGAQLDATFDLGHMMGASALNITRGATGSGTAGADGRFEVAGLGRGPFSLTCKWEAPDGRVYSARSNGLPPGTTDLKLRLLEPLFLAGRLLDSQDRPIDGLVVSCARLLDGSMGDVRIDKQEVTSNAEGSFRFDVDQDRFELVVAGDSFVSLEPMVVQVTGSQDDLRLVCAQAVTASGRVLDPKGSPVAGATVSLETGASAIQAQSGLSDQAPSTRTDKDGSFKLVGVKPGLVILTAEMEKLARVSTDATEAAPGEALTGIVLQLGRGGAVEGICFDNDGRTAPGRIVSVTSLSQNLNRSTLSDEDGTFRVEGLTPGAYQVVAVDPNMQSSGDLDASSLAEMWEYMKLATADVVEDETSFVFLGAPPSDPVDVVGRVTQGGEPFSGALITWLPASEGMQERMETAEVDKNGRYSARLNQTGPYIVNLQRISGIGVQQETIEFDVEVPEGTKELTQDFVVPSGGITGRVLKVDGSPAVGVRIAVTGVGALPTNRLMGNSYAELRTDTSGRYVVSGLRPGDYQISAGGASFLGTADSAPARVTVGPRSVSKDEVLSDVDLQLVEPGTINITVTDSTGAGVSGASVFLLDDQGRHSEMFSVQSTGQGGTLRMNSVAPGTYTLSARTGDLASQESLILNVRAGEASAMVLPLESGTLIDATVKLNGEAVAGGTLQIIDAEGRDLTRRMGLADTQQIYQGDAFTMTSRVFGPFPPGDYMVKASGPDGTAGTRRVRLKGTKARQKVTVKLK